MTPSPDIQHSEDIRQLRRMRLASILEATTLALLIFVAVPMKHIFGISLATSIMGPIHGLAFLYYIWMLIQTVTGSQWPRSTVARMVLFAFIPLAGFVNERLLWREEQRLSARTA